jgi:hypothetical protein
MFLFNINPYIVIKWKYVVHKDRLDFTFYLVLYSWMILERYILAVFCCLAVPYSKVKYLTKKSNMLAPLVDDNVG